MHYIDETDKKISSFGTLFDSLDKETLSSFFNVKRSQIFRRSYQDFYIVWLVLHNKTIEQSNKELIKQQIIELLCLLRNTEGKEVDDAYHMDFEKRLQKLTQ